LGLLGGRTIMNRGVCYLLFLSILLGQEGIPPEWEENRRSDTNSYIGISFVEINNRPPSVYLEEADDQAILEISKQIQVKVIGESESIFKERGLDVEHSYSQENLVYTISNIKELQKVEGKIIGNGYWVYWKVSKDAYEQSKQEAIKAARSQFEQFIITNKADVTQRLRYLILALEIISQYPDSDFNLQNQVKNELNRMIDQLRLEPESEFIAGTYDRRLDKPIKVFVTSYIEEYEGRTDLQEVQVNNLPITFTFSKGSGTLTFPSKRTDVEGISITQITRITDPQPRQEITIMPDLLALKPNSKVFPLLDDELKKMALINQTKVEIDVLKEMRLEVAVYVSGLSGLNNLEIVALNDAFEATFKEETQWKIRSRDLADKAIKQKGLNPLDACTNRECRIEIVNALDIEELILISLSYDPQNRIVRCTMKLENVKKDETEIIHRDSKSIPDGIIDIPDYIEKNTLNNWVNEFIKKSKPARTSVIAGGGQTINMLIDGDRENPFILPYYEDLQAGTYNLTFYNSGYEHIDTTISAIPSEPFSLEIELRKKSRLKAFALSAFPGQGQRYSSGITNPNRNKTGFYYTVGGAIAVIATGYTWYSYGQAVDNYNSSKSHYLKQNQMSEINLNRSITQNAQQKMTDNYQIAISISAATIGFWIYNMVEAAINLTE